MYIFYDTHSVIYNFVGMAANEFREKNKDIKMGLMKNFLFWVWECDFFF